MKAYLQRRQNLIYEGDPPDDASQPDPSLPELAQPAASGASAP